MNYYRGDTIDFYISFDKTNKMKIHKAQIRILHDQEGTIYEDLPWTDLNLIKNNEYNFNFLIPQDFSYGQFQVIYRGTVEEKFIYSYETFNVIPQIEKYENTIKLYGFINDSKSGLPLEYVSVTVFEKYSNTIYFKSLTNREGYWESYIYPGEYNFSIKKDGYNTQDINIQIGNEHRELQFNNIVLENFNTQNGKGMFKISDEFVTNTGLPLRELVITIYDALKPLNVIAKDVTNLKGQWTCFLNAGNYLMYINGKSMGKDYDIMARLKVEENGEFNIGYHNKQNIVTEETKGTGSVHFKDVFLDNFNKPIVNVQIIVYTKGTKTLIAENYSDLNGEFEFFLNPGKYTFEYYHPNFKTITEDKIIT